MARQLIFLRVVAIFPSDVKPERKRLPGILERVNRDAAHPSGLHLDLCAWDTDASPTFHPYGPQGSIDSTLRIDESDVVICIFWRRLGTPTADGKTGTEHEFFTAYESWKKIKKPDIKVYFSDKKHRTNSRAEVEQLEKLWTFKESFPKEGLWWNFKNEREFEILVEQHLRGYVATKSGELLPHRDNNGWDDLPSKTIAPAVGNPIEPTAMDGVPAPSAARLLNRPEFSEIRTTFGLALGVRLISHLLRNETAEMDRLIEQCGLTRLQGEHLNKVCREAVRFSALATDR
jgi:hypothetical protein